MVAGPVDPRLAMMMKMMREMRKHVEENAEYVGDSSPRKPARSITTKPKQRGIYGEATADEAKALIEEGIAVLPLPRLPEDGN